MKRVSVCLLLLLLLPTFALAKDELPTAEELYAQYPVPEVELTRDPADDPMLILVNKRNKLPWDYVPEGMVLPDVTLKSERYGLMEPTAAAALTAMFQAAKSEAGLELVGISGYRSYSSQKSIYQNAVKEKGQKQADRANAQPGKSEHQTGLAMDVSCESLHLSLSQKFGDTPEGQWIAENAHRFGFVIRYRKAWYDVTLYMNEPWHLRYIGPEHAAFLRKLDVPFETYREYLELVWQAQAGAETSE